MAEPHIEPDVVLQAITAPDHHDGDNLPIKHKVKVPRRDQRQRALIESWHLSTMAAAYNHHFAIYSRDRKQVTQLIPKAVWKSVYTAYLEAYPDSQFAEDTLKDRLRETLKELKTTGTSNEEGSDKKVLQSDEALAQLKAATDGHATTRNALKRRQSFIDGTTHALISYPTSSSIGADGPKSAPSSTSGPSSTSTPTDKAMTMAELLQQQSRSIVALAHQFQSSSEKRDALVAAKLEISNEKKNKVKISNLKAARDLGVITDEEFKAQVKSLLKL